MFALNSPKWQTITRLNNEVDSNEKISLIISTVGILTISPLVWSLSVER